MCGDRDIFTFAFQMVLILSSLDSRVVVAYEADDLDPQRRLGWSVVVTGWATPVSDPDQISRYEQLLQPWVNLTMDTVIAIDPAMVTGIRIVSTTPYTLTGRGPRRGGEFTTSPTAP